MSEDPAWLNVGFRGRLKLKCNKSKTTARLTPGLDVTELHIKKSHYNNITRLYNGANVCLVSSIAVSFIKNCPFRSN